MSESGDSVQVEPKVKVVYIMGWGRSGSTLLDNILGQIDGFFSAGELHYLWDRGLAEGRPCGCGRSLPECDVWSAILDEFARDLGADVDGDDFLDLQERTVRNRHAPLLLGWVPSRRAQKRDVARYTALLSSLYRSIARATGARVVVDSSKRIPRAALLLGMEGIEPYFIHLVRDPRAVAYSWSHSKPLSAAGDRDMRRFGAFASTLRWVLWTSGAAAVRRRARERSMLVTYETFVKDPRGTVENILSLVREEGQLPFVDPVTVELAPTHTVSGNPSRFVAGPATIRADDRWRGAQKPKDRLVATAVALPLLRRYGYVVGVGKQEP